MIFKDFHDFESSNLRAWADDTGTGLAEREPHRQTQAERELNRQNGKQDRQNGNCRQGLWDRPQLRAPANNKSHEWVSIRGSHWQNVNHTGRTGTRTGRTGIGGKGLCDRPQLRPPANNKSI